MPTPLPQLLQVQHIEKSFREAGQTLHVLHDINLTIHPGEFVCLIGPSGSGKSTFLRILANLLAADSGTITRPDTLRQSMVFQNFALFPWLTVEANIAFGLRRQALPETKIHQIVTAQIKAMGLNGFEQHHPRELSGGMKQRVGIARALAIRPDILFMDEPFSALDAFTADTLRRDVLTIWEDQKMTVVMVTHLVEEAVELADRIIVFSAQPGSIKETVTNDLPRPRNQRSQAFYDHVDSLHGKIMTR